MATREQQDHTGTEREKGWLAILLAWVAGVVDAVGYLTLYQLFTAHMSGNSVRFGLDLGQGQWAAALRRATPIPLFVLGVVLGTVLIEVTVRRGMRSAFSVVMALEAVLLLAYLVYGRTLLHAGTIHVDAPWQYYLLAALLAVPMGLQTAALQRAAGRTVQTTFVTGMLTNCAKEAVVYLFWLHDRRSGTVSEESASQGILPRHPSRDQALLLGGIWVGYVVGAVVGGYTQVRWSLDALALPLGALALVIVLDVIRPIYALATGEADRQSA